MRIHVSFTPFDPVDAPLAVVIDVLRATSTITQALASGYERVICCTEIEDAQTLAAEHSPAVLGGERKCSPIPGFNFGNSPREYVGEPAAPTLVLSTTNGTRLLVTAAAHAERVLVASLLNLESLIEAVRADGADELDILCAGSRGELCLDDAYVAGRIAQQLDGDRTDSATAAIRLAQSFASADDGLRVSQSARNIVAAGLEEDIAYCAQESIHAIVPRLKGSVGAGVEVTLS
jgi:2-phosphosulfolactate phosphatase